MRDQSFNQSDFEKNGFFVFKDPEVIFLKKKLSESLCNITKTIAKKINTDLSVDDEIWSDGSVVDLITKIHLFESDNQITKACYEVFPTCPDVLGLISNPLIKKVISQAGVSIPVAGTVPLVRIDRPFGDYYATPWHQDYWYSFLSENAIVIWIPLSIVDADMGRLRCKLGSHKDGVLPFKANENSNEPYETCDVIDDSCSVDINLASDEILIFNQKLLHRSGLNRSTKVRMSIQLRVNDLATAKKMVSTFSAKHSSYVMTEQENLRCKD